MQNRKMSMIVEERWAPYQTAISNELIEPKQQEPIMKLSYIATAILFSASATLSAQAQAQTISVNPQTLIMNFAAGENLLARIAQPIPGLISAITTTAPTAPVASATTASAPVGVASATTPVASAAAPVAPVSAPANPVLAQAPVDVPHVIGGQKIGPDAQRVTKCLIENHGDRYICGMQELNGEIAKCVGGVGTVGGCFTAPLTRPIAAAVAPSPRPHYYPRYYPRHYNNYFNFF
jgi:hypothetical protein